MAIYSIANAMPLATSKASAVYCLIIVMAIAAGIGGCKKQSGSESVHGKVSHRGEPLANGLVNFFPATGRSVAASVTNGEYAIELAPGNYTITVDIGSQLPPGFKEGDPVPPPKVVLPPEYTERAKSTLKTSVEPGQSDPINFDLK